MKRKENKYKLFDRVVCGSVGMSQCDPCANEIFGIRYVNNQYNDCHYKYSFFQQTEWHRESSLMSVDEYRAKKIVMLKDELARMSAQQKPKQKGNKNGI